MARLIIKTASIEINQILLSEVERCHELFNLKILQENTPYAQSVFIEILIRLEFILRTLNARGKRIDWNDDVQVTKEIKDITSLVNYMRNAACHVESGKDHAGFGLRSVFNRIIGRAPNVIKIGKIISGCDYKDDVAFYYGDKRIYLNRHIKRLLEEIPTIITI